MEKLLRSKVVVWILIVLPGLWPIWPIFVREDPSVLADPLKFVLHHFGFVACVLLAIVLTFTPLRVLFPKWGIALALNRHRRLVGVSAFVYAALHLTTHLVYESAGPDGRPQIAALPKIFLTALEKPFQLTGLIAFTILLVLAITSLHAMVRWLGGKRWKNLHRLVYVAAALLTYHQAAARKIFPMQVVWIFGPVVILEVLRIWKKTRPTPPIPTKPQPASAR